MVTELLHENYLSAQQRDAAGRGGPKGKRLVGDLL